MDQVCLLAGGEVHHELAYAAQLRCQVHRTLIGARADPCLVADLACEDPGRLEYLGHREGDVGIRYLQVGHLGEGAKDRFSGHRRGVIAAVPPGGRQAVLAAAPRLFRRGDGKAPRLSVPLSVGLSAQ